MLGKLACEMYLRGDLIKELVMNKEGQNKQIKKLHIELYFDYFVNCQMERLDQMVNKARKDGVPERHILKLEESFDEYIKTCIEIFQQYGGEFTVNLVYEKIQNNMWVRLHKKVLEDPEIKMHILKYKESIMSSGIDEASKAIIKKDLERKLKGTDVF